MCECEKYGRADDGDQDRLAGPSLKDALDETPINQLLAERDRQNQGKKGQAFDVVLRKELQRQLRYDAVSFFGLQDEAAQTHNLIEQNQRRKHDGDADGERWIGKGQAELIRANLVDARAPQNQARGDPLQCDSGRVQREAIHLYGAGYLH
jgi:hypothetical protein